MSMKLAFLYRLKPKKWIAKVGPAVTKFKFKSDNLSQLVKKLIPQREIKKKESLQSSE